MNTNNGKSVIKNRQSSLELLRIISMITIISLHYVVNSGLMGLYDYNSITGNMIFLQFFSSIGKAGVNVFILISCYFMCTSKLTWKRVLKLFLEIEFYSIIIFIIFSITGYTEFNLANAARTVLTVVYTLNVSFTGSFMVFYLLIPFLNRTLKSFSKNAHRNLCAILIFIFTIIPTFFKNDTWNYIGWFVTIYYIASYIRLYPSKYTEEKKYSLVTLIISFGLIFSSIIFVDYVGKKFGFTNAYYMCSDSNKLLAVTCAVSAFLLFKNINMGYRKWINIIASTTFGVYLIHTRGEAMRNFLWKDLLKNVDFYGSNILPVHAIVSVILIFIVCSVIDYIRIKVIETPLLGKINNIAFLNRECFFKHGDD